MKAREFVRKHVEPVGGVLERTDGDHHIYRLPNGRTFVVPMGGRQSEAAHWLLPKLRRLLRVAPVGAMLLLLASCGGGPFTLAPAAVVDPAAGDGGEDAAPGPEASREADDGHSSDAIDHDAGPWPEEAGTNPDAGGSGYGSSGGSSGSSGSSSGSSGAPDSGADAGGVGPCDGAMLYTHNTGTGGHTWQDCVPTGTYDAAEAAQACEVWRASNGGSCNQESVCNPAVTMWVSTTEVYGSTGGFYNGWAWLASGAGDAISVSATNSNVCSVIGTWN